MKSWEKHIIPLHIQEFCSYFKKLRAKVSRYILARTMSMDRSDVSHCCLFVSCLLWSQTSYVLQVKETVNFLKIKGFLFCFVFWPEPVPVEAIKEEQKQY